LRWVVQFLVVRAFVIPREGTRSSRNRTENEQERLLFKATPSKLVTTLQRDRRMAYRLDLLLDLRLPLERGRS
jgi:hypothetical protein